MEIKNDEKEQLVQMRGGFMVPERGGEYWTDEEREKLCMLFFSGVGLTTIALELRRTEMAVVQQLCQLGLFSPQNSPRKKRKKDCQCLCEQCSLVESCSAKNDAS